jgi:hypothetical protein
MLVGSFTEPKVLDLYNEMLKVGHLPTESALTCVLMAYSALGMEQQVHEPARTLEDCLHSDRDT